MCILNFRMYIVVSINDVTEVNIKKETEMKYKELIAKMTLEEKASPMSGKDFWQTAGWCSDNSKRTFL